MTRLFLDTNILLDLLAKRLPHYSAAASLFSLADKGKVHLSVSSLSIVNTHYILRKCMDRRSSREIITDLGLLITVFPPDSKIIGLALNSDFIDFEDAIYYHTALENDQQAIITRNQADFKKSSLPVMNAMEFLRSQ